MKVETDTTEKSEILIFIKAGLLSRLYLFHIGCYDRRVASADGHREPKILGSSGFLLFKGNLRES